jgi:hypothetical protein
MVIIASILWRSVHTAGHDACALSETEHGWQIDGAAVFRHGAGRRDSTITSSVTVCGSADSGA